MTTTLKICKSRKTTFNLKCIPLEWQMLLLNKLVLWPVYSLSKQTEYFLSSKLEIALLLASDASVSVRDIPTYLTIMQLFSVSNFDKHDTSKTLTIANQSEIAVEQYISLVCFSIIETQSRYFMMLFAKVDIKYTFLGTPLFEKKQTDY